MDSSRANRKAMRDYGITILVAASVALLIRFFVIEAYRIPSTAMKPTLEPGDTIFVAKWPFGLRLPGMSAPITPGTMPDRGDIVVFSAPDSRRDSIKRVIALPGETVQLLKGQLLLNGAPVPTRDASASCALELLAGAPAHGVCWEPPAIEDFGPEKVPAGSVFLLGDLRTQSTADSRKQKAWAIVPVTSLKGRALWIWLSVEPRSFGSHAGWFPQFRFERMLRRIQ